MTPQILGTSRKRKSNINTSPELIDRINRRVYPEEEKPIPEKDRDKGLTGKLERDEDGKPKLKLKHLENTVVNTSTQIEYDLLMQVYECGGWKWMDQDIPTNYNSWSEYFIDNCISVEIGFGYDYKSWYQEVGCNIISPQEFYEIQNISSDTLAEVNNWFETHKPDRESKGK